MPKSLLFPLQQSLLTDYTLPTFQLFDHAKLLSNSRHFTHFPYTISSFWKPTSIHYLSLFQDISLNIMDLFNCPAFWLHFPFILSYHTLDFSIKSPLLDEIFILVLNEFELSLRYQIVIFKKEGSIYAQALLLSQCLVQCQIHGTCMINI